MDRYIDRERQRALEEVEESIRVSLGKTQQAKRMADDEQYA